MARAIRHPSGLAHACVGSLVWLVLIMMAVVFTPGGFAQASGLAAPRVLVEAEADAGRAGSEGGACGDEEEQSEDLVNCGATLSPFERPGLLAMLRESIERMNPRQCRELLDILYEREICSIGGRDCGDVLPLAIPPLPPRSVSNGSSGQSWLEQITVLPDTGRTRIGRASDDRVPRARAIAPPDRPPRSLAPD